MFDFLQEINNVDFYGTIVIIEIFSLIFHIIYYTHIDTEFYSDYFFIKFLFSIFSSIIGFLNFIPFYLIFRQFILLTTINETTIFGISFITWSTINILLFVAWISSSGDFRGMFIFNLTPNLKLFLYKYIDYYKNEKNIKNELAKNYKQFKQNIKL
jgi:hypothetical protein